MVVTLMRHGPSAYRGAGWLSPSAIIAWATSYAAAGLRHGATPPTAARRVADAVAIILTSDRSRAIESARSIAPGRDLETSPLWREAPLPDLTLVGLRWPTMLSLGISRLVWYWGIAAGAESVTAACARAAVAATELEARCRTYGHVLLVGHGIFNRLVATVLRMRGWRGPRRLDAGYWTTATFAASAV